MPRRGRPPTPKGHGLDTEIKIRVKESEKAQFKAAAARVPTTLSNWARVELLARSRAILGLADAPAVSKGKNGR